MTKLPRHRTRKPPRRKQPRTIEIEDELAQLALVLDEQRLERGATGWFALPWRDGVNAFGLSVATAEHLVRGPIKALDSLNEDKYPLDLLYEHAEELFAETSSRDFSVKGAAIKAACRCLQLKISRSDGGGHGYNVILSRYIAQHVPDALVEIWRARDALGYELEFDGTARDRVRGAFRIAWRRGLFRAAYALGGS